jgi:hypothetical protein
MEEFVRCHFTNKVMEEGFVWLPAFDALYVADEVVLISLIKDYMKECDKLKWFKSEVDKWTDKDFLRYSYENELHYWTTFYDI